MNLQHSLQIGQRPLPLRFAILNTYSYRLDAPLVPLLYVRFPEVDVTSDDSIPPSFIDVVRILDPEHRSVPFVSSFEMDSSLSLT